VDLLNPYRRAIPLAGRERDLASLWQWLDSPRPVAVRTLTGRAGAGKTRIAIELIEQLNSQRPGKWWAGFVRGRDIREFARQKNLSDWAWARPTLVVVDYAASVAEPLRESLRDLATVGNRAECRPPRLLLLEREAAKGGWLESICRGGYSEYRVRELFDPPEPKRLDRLEAIERLRDDEAFGCAIDVRAVRTEYRPIPIRAIRAQRPLATRPLGRRRRWQTSCWPALR
jgi:hypothetical protein